MRKLWVMIRKELREGVATRSFIIGTILTPAILVAVFAIPAWLMDRSKNTTYTIAVLEVGSHALVGFTDFAERDTLDTGVSQWKVEYQSVAPPDSARVIEALTGRALKRDVDAFIVTDSGIWDSGDALLYSANVSRMEMIRELQGHLSDFVIAGRTTSRGLNTEEARALTRRVEFDAHKVAASGRSKSEFMSDYIGALLFVMLLFIMIFGYGTQLMRALFEEKSARIIEVLVSSVTPFQIMMGKIVGQGLVALAQIAAWVALGLLVGSSGIAISGRVGSGLAILGSLSFVLWFVIYMLLGYLFYSCWFATVGAVVSSDQEAQPLVGPVVMVMMIPVIMMLAVINDPNSLWMRLMSIIPPFSPSAMVMRLNLTSVPLWEIALSVVLLATAVLVAGWVAARVFRIGILMTGKRPTLPEAMRWIRYS